MEYFPLVLLRVAGLPKDTLLPLRWTEWGNIDQLFRDAERQSNLRTTILEEMEALHRQLEDPFLQKRLSYLRADFREKDRIRLDKTKALFAEASRLMDLLKAYLQIQEEIAAGQQAFETLYAQKVLANRQQLQKLSASPELQNGLLFSSASLIDRIAAYQKRPIAEFRKKERQTQQTVLQYLSRIVFKTSPFSSFCGLDIKALNRVGEESSPDRLLQLNNYLLAHLQERLEEHPDFYRRLYIQRNSGIQQTATHYTFILNSRNAESVQVLERDELLDLIFDMTSSSCLFSHLLISLQQQIDSTAEELEQWLMQLVKVGFLEWQWPFSILSLDADQQLLQALQESSQPPELEALSLQLAQFIQYKTEFQTAPFSQRRKLLQQVADLLAEVKATTPREESATPLVSYFHKFDSHPLELSREKIFYEDLRQPAELQITQEQLTPFAKTLQRLAEGIRPIQYSRINDEIHRCLATHFPTQKTISLLDFYQVYHQYQPPATSLQQSAIESLRQAWKQQLSTQLHPAPNGDLHLTLDLLAQLPQGPPSTTQWAHSNAALLQLAHRDNQWLAYTDACITGYGKHFGRFLPLFPPSYTETIHQANRLLHPGTLHLELSDNSFFNANQHPPLFTYELSLSGSRNQLPASQQIPITEIAIHRPDEKSPLQLLHLPSQQPILPFDIGVESLQSRSPMYRLLAAFSPATPAISEFNVLLNDCYGLDQNGMIHFPRILLEGHLLLQRKHWYLPVAQLPIPHKGESDAAYFLRIQRWHRQHFPAPQLFLTLQPSNITFEGQPTSASSSGDAHKPQYFDLASPDFVRLLGRQLKGQEGYIKIEEMWPMADEVSGAHVMEVLLQWAS